MQLDRLSSPVIDARNATAYAPGACGELAQGQFQNGDDFLITLLVNLHSEVQVNLNFAYTTIQGIPARKEKIYFTKELKILQELYSLKKSRSARRRFGKNDRTLVIYVLQSLA